MAKCNSCNGVITRTDTECYVCGEPVPGRNQWSFAKLFWPKPSVQAAKRVSMEDVNRRTTLSK